MKRVDPSLAAILLVLTTGLGRASGQDRAAVSGVVRDLHGIPQLGALVELLGPGSSVLAHTYTDDHGRYLLPAPEAGRYELRTSAAFLLPVLRRNLRVTESGKTLANVTMSALFEVGDWFPVERRSKTEPADDWRWTVRSSAERPLLRLAEDSTEQAAVDSVYADRENEPDASQEHPASARERQEHEQLSVFVGAASLMEDGVQQSLLAERQTADGSLFSLRAAVNPEGEGERSPAILLGTGYQHENSFSHSQYRAVVSLRSLPELTGAGGSGYQEARLATGERVLLGDLVTIDAGTLLSAERLISDRISTAPFLRLVVHPVADVAVMYRYAGSREVQDLHDVGLDKEEIAPLSDAAGRPLGSSASHQEVALARSMGRDVATLAIYRDAFTAGALEGGGATQTEDFANMPVLSNANSGRFVVAVGGYTAHGVSGSWTHSFSADLKATLVADFGTTLAVQGSREADIRSIQDSIKGCMRPSFTASFSGEVHKTATTFEVRYHWQPTDTLTVINSFDTASDEAYAGILLKQRLWRGRQLRSVSAVLEASNLLEEGYQPVLGPDGETLFLAQVPRAIQAGLNFSF